MSMSMRFMSTNTVATSQMLNNRQPQSAIQQPQQQPRQIYERPQIATFSRRALVPPLPQTAVPTPEDNKKKVVWGPAVWYAMHTMSVKVKEESFQLIRAEILNMIKLICENLPCPDCAQHATEYIRTINFNNIKTKEDLKVMLFTFHNKVNQRKGYPLFEYDQLNELYNKANTVAVLQNFLLHFQDRKYRSIKLIATDLHRGLLCKDFNAWFSKNIQHFDA